MRQIYHVRLLNGDELFGSVYEIYEDNTKVRIVEPLCTTELEDMEGNVTIGLMDYLPFSENNQCDVSKGHIISCTKVHPDISNFYELSKHFTEKANSDMLNKIQFTSAQMLDSINQDHLVANNVTIFDQSDCVH
jgi:hypothetical protein